MEPAQDPEILWVIRTNPINRTRNVVPILEVLKSAGSTSESTGRWIFRVAEIKYRTQVLTLTSKKSGFRFPASTATAKQLTGTSINDLGTEMRHIAPDLWRLLEGLHAADPVANERRAERAYSMVDTVIRLSNDGGISMADATDSKDDETGEAAEPNGISLVDAEDDMPEDLSDHIATQFGALIKIKQVLCLSVRMHSTNQWCNALQSIISVFLHACNVPETVLELLAHMGMSISTTSVNKLASNLSKESGREIQKVGCSLLAIYAYDNLDVDLKHLVPTVEDPLNTLVHLTTGLLMPLAHGITLDDLDCSDYLWKRYHNNINTQPQDIPIITFHSLHNIHPETLSSTGLNQRKRFNAWKYLSDLVEFGPAYFQKFKVNLKDPEAVDPIPLIKTSQTPLCALNISPNSAGNNANALDLFFQQTGVGDSEVTPGVRDPQNRVILLSGDLLTIEHLRTLRATRAEESSSWGRIQYMVPVMGLFHLKMACADGIWRIFINSKGKQRDPNDLMTHISQIRPKETRKMETKPGFRRMHEVIQHTGIVSRLEVWRITAKKMCGGLKTLEEFGQLAPSWEMLQEMAIQIAKRNPTPSGLSRMRAQDSKERDKQLENMILREEYFLLYEEISYGLNYGDIGRVESCFMPWIYIFAGCGKHKYAAEMRRYLEDVHHVYPEGLRRAVRMNILCNPTGKKGHFRPLDWVVEHNNLYIKRIYGGRYSNHTQAHIIKESPLIEVYKDVRVQFEKMFCLEHKTIRHSSPKMKNTFDKLGEYMQKELTHIHVKGRDAHSITDMMSKGMHLALVGKVPGERTASGDPEEQEDDIDEEVLDDGSLDI